MRRFLIVACLGLGLVASGPAEAFPTTAGEVAVTLVAQGLEEPWALGFLPGGRYLVTERGGRLWLGDGADLAPVEGTPPVVARGQGGLLDIMVPRDFSQSRQVFLSYVTAQRGGGAGTALAVARLSQDGRRLTGLRRLFEMRPGSRGGRHFGSRIVEAADGRIFLTIGDRADRDLAQDPGRHNGSVIRLNRDGSVPADNPFVGQPGALPEIWSIGHRNPQGAALDEGGRLWISEHGARGGDEINLVRRGANYGWPVISYGRHYSGLPIGEGTAKDGMEQPAHYWDPSIAPSGMLIYSGRLWPEWRGDIFVGSLKFDRIERLSGAPDALQVAEVMQSPEMGRVRDLREAPDGSIWFLSVNEGAVFRMAPGD